MQSTKGQSHCAAQRDADERRRCLPYARSAVLCALQLSQNLANDFRISLAPHSNASHNSGYRRVAVLVNQHCRRLPGPAPKLRENLLAKSRGDKASRRLCGSIGQRPLAPGGEH